MTKGKRILAKLGAAFKRAGRLIARNPLVLPMLLIGAAAAILAYGLPWRLESAINAMSFAVARRIAGTGITESAPLRAEALTLLKLTLAAALLYLCAVWLALQCARRAQNDLRAALEAKRAVYVEKGFVPPETWADDAAKDTRRLSAAVASVPELMMLIAAFTFCGNLLSRLPSVAAAALPVTAILVFYAVHRLTERGIARPVRTIAVAGLWAAGTLTGLAGLLKQTPNSLLLGTVVMLMLAMTVIIPAVLLLPWRSALPTWAAFKRIRTFLK